MSVITELRKLCKDGHTSIWTVYHDSTTDERWSSNREGRARAFKSEEDMQGFITFMFNNGFTDTQQLSLNLA